MTIQLQSQMRSQVKVMVIHMSMNVNKSLIMKVLGNMTILTQTGYIIQNKLKDS